MKTLDSTPHVDGFYMPGEFEPHTACWMLWPERPDMWRNNAHPAQKAFAAVADAISQFEPVRMGVSAAQFDRARQMLPAKVDVIRLDYNDAWMRDNGVTFVVDGDHNVRGIDWNFNAWGGLYPDFRADDALACQLLTHLDINRYKAPLVMEGGSIDVDGEGTLIVTEQCLLNPNRNPSLTKAQIEAYLRGYLNVEKVIWLQDGLFNDETNGHIDNLCCFVRPTIIALTWTDDEDDPNHAICTAAYNQLINETDAKDRPLTVHKIHQPNPVRITAEEVAGLVVSSNTIRRNIGERYASSYVNYYVANGGVIVPQFDDEWDQPALDTIQKLFPEREVVGIYSREIILGGGNIHCITQQQPA